MLKTRLEVETWIWVYKNKIYGIRIFPDYSHSEGLQGSNLPVAGTNTHELTEQGTRDLLDVYIQLVDAGEFFLFFSYWIESSRTIYWNEMNV